MFLFSGFAFLSASAAERGPRDERVPGQYIVVLKDSVQNVDAAENEMVIRGRGERLHSYRSVVKGFTARFSDAELEKLRKDPRVAYVSEDRVVSIQEDGFGEAAKASGSSKIKPSLPSQTVPTGVDRINAEAKMNTGAGVNVAVIDTGILTTHPDLSANIAGGKSCIGTTGSYTDQNGHGTHVAGTIAALNNTHGVVGVAPGAKLWAVRVLDRNGNGTWSSVICGLDFVTSKAPVNGGPIKVANLSLSGAGTSDNNCGNTNNDALHRAICRARDAGVTIVVAAGNSGVNASGEVPAAYDDAVITVSALADSDGKLGGLGGATSYGADDTFASFSNYGPSVDIGAPGVAIRSTWLSNGYNTISGTSMASPHVAGAAALYLAANPGASWTAVRDALIAGGESLGSGHTDPGGLHPENVLRADTL